MKYIISIFLGIILGLGISIYWVQKDWPSAPIHTDQALENHWEEWGTFSTDDEAATGSVNVTMENGSHFDFWIEYPSTNTPNCKTDGYSYADNCTLQQ